MKRDLRMMKKDSEKRKETGSKRLKLTFLMPRLRLIRDTISGVLSEKISLIAFKSRILISILHEPKPN